MPKAPSAETVRERAHHRALATVAALPVTERQVMPDEQATDERSRPENEIAGDASAQTRADGDQTCYKCGKTGWKIDEFLSPFNGLCIECHSKEVLHQQEDSPLPETQEEEMIETQFEELIKQKPLGRPRKEIKESTHRGVDEDFFDYLARIDPKDWSSVQTSGLYIYKLQSGGNLRIGPVLRKAITFDELKDIAIKHGPGNYKVQFQTRLTHLTKCGEVVPFDADSLPENASQRMQNSQSEMKGFDKAIEASSNMLEHSAKTAIDLHKSVQIEQHKQPDVAGIVTAVVSAVAALIPKQDNTMIQFLITDAQRRADAAEKDADRREQRAKEEAERRERDSERRAAEAKLEADRQRERDKEFFGLMLKQAESKADSLNQMTGLLTSFMKVKETIDDTMGGGPKGPWDLAGNVIDGVLQQGPAIVAALKGAPAQQVAQMQNPAAQPHPEAQPFYEMIIRLAKYFQRDPANYNGQYLVDMIEAEYGAVFSEIINQPKDDVLKAVAAFEPYGKAIMEHPQASVLMAKIIDAIKFPDTMDDIFPDDEDKIPEENPPMIHGKAKPINGKAKGAA